MRCSGRARPARPAAPATARGARRAWCPPGVDLVHDHGLHRGQHRAGLRGQDQEERLGGGDQDVGRLAQHARALRRPGCRRCGCRRRARGRPRRARGPRARCPRAARAGCAPRPRPAPAAARRRRRGSAPRGGGRARTSAGRWRRGTRPASCPSRWARRPARSSPPRMAGQPELLRAGGAGERLREPLRHRGMEGAHGGGRSGRGQLRGAVGAAPGREGDPGQAEGAVAGGRRRAPGTLGATTWRTIRKIAKATIRKLTTAFRKSP